MVKIGFCLEALSDLGAAQASLEQAYFLTRIAAKPQKSKRTQHVEHSWHLSDKGFALHFGPLLKIRGIRIGMDPPLNVCRC